MTPQMERHLMEMGVIPATPLEDLSTVVDYSTPTLTKNHFNDPRDENGEVPY